MKRLEILQKSIKKDNSENVSDTIIREDKKFLRRKIQSLTNEIEDLQEELEALIKNPTYKIDENYIDSKIRLEKLIEFKEVHKKLEDELY